MLNRLQELVTGEYADLPVIALEPTAAGVLRVAGKYRYKLLIKARNTARMRQMVRQLLTDFHACNDNRGVSVYVDIDPASML